MENKLKRRVKLYKESIEKLKEIGERLNKLETKIQKSVNNSTVKRWSNNTIKTEEKQKIKENYNKTKEYAILLEFLESKDIMKDYNEEKEDLIVFMEGKRSNFTEKQKIEFKEFKRVEQLKTQQERLNTLIEQRKEVYNKFKSKLKGKTIDEKTIENINKTALGLTSKQDVLVELEILEQITKELDEQLKTTDKGSIMTK